MPRDSARRRLWENEWEEHSRKIFVGTQRHMEKEKENECRWSTDELVMIRLLLFFIIIILIESLTR